MKDYDSMAQLTEEIRKFTEERDWDQFHSPENLAKSVAIEAGELLECFQWGSEPELEAVTEEIADVMNYCLLLADKLGIDPGKAIHDKIQKNAEKYPVEKSRGKSTKYDRKIITGQMLFYITGPWFISLKMGRKPMLDRHLIFQPGCLSIRPIRIKLVLQELISYIQTVRISP